MIGPTSRYLPAHFHLEVGNGLLAANHGLTTYGAAYLELAVG